MPTPSAPAQPAAPSAGEIKDILIHNQTQMATFLRKQEELERAVKLGSEEAAAKLAEMEQRVSIMTQPNGRRPLQPAGLSEKDKKQFSYVKAFRGIHSKDWDGCEHERDVFKAGAQCRAQAGGTDSAGGYWLPPELSSDFIELLRPALVLQDAGATIDTDVAGSPYEITGQAGGATAVMIGENSPITESQLAAKMLKATPHMVGAFVKAPLGFINRATSPNAEQKIRNDMAAAVARKMELEIFEGTGAGVSLLGLRRKIAEVGLNTTVGSPQAPTWQNFVRLRGKVMDQNVGNMVDQRTAAFISTDKGVRAFLLQGINQHATSPGDLDRAPAYGSPIFTPNELAARIGTKVLTTNALTNLDSPSTEVNPPMFFGIWRELIIPIWGQVMLATSDTAGDAFQNVQLFFRAVAEFDYLPRYTEAFTWARIDASAA